MSTGNLYLTSDIGSSPISAISTSVGSGKTRAAVDYMAHDYNSTQNFIYIAPTVKLVNQTRKNLEQRISQLGSFGRNIHLIHSEAPATTANGRHEAISDQVLERINAAAGGVGHVVLCTTRTLLHVLSRISRPEEWGLILDEAFSPVSFQEIHLGERKGTRRGSWAAFLDLFQLVPEQNNRIVPATDRVSLVRQIAQRDWKRAGIQYQGLQELATSVSNPALRVELVGSEEVTLEEGVDPLVASYVTPEYFQGFREVLFMSALFEHTVLYHLWTKVFGVTFKTHPVVKADSPSVRNLHKEQGQFVSVGYLLHPDDNSSLRNLSRDSTTGEENAPEGKRVIDAMVSITEEFFWGRRYLLQTNGRFGYFEGSELVPRGAVVIPTISHGLNDWSDHDCVAALAVTNPTPPQARWVQCRTGMSLQETLLSYRLHTQYQAVGRSSVRKSTGTKNQKTFLVPSKADADAMLAIWDGSKALGKVGNLPKLSAMRAPTKLDMVCKALGDYLAALPMTTTKVSIRSAKAAVGEVTSDTWDSARRKFLGSQDSWVIQGQSLARA